MPDSTTPDRIAAVVLAAGAGERMGATKQLLDYRGEPLLQHVVDAVEASTVDAVVVVTGAHGDLVESGVRLGRAVYVRNPDFRGGNMSSLACGAAALPEADAIVVLMGDQPEVTSGVIGRLAATWVAEHPWGGVTEYPDGPAHPYLLSKPALQTAIAVGGPKLLWRLLVAEPGGPVTRIKVDGPKPIDVNTPDDLERLLGRNT